MRLRLGTGVCLFLNRFFPKPKVVGRESPQAYSEGQYCRASSEAGLRLHERFVDLRNKRVLDAGCGLGGRSVYYAEQGPHFVAGIDVDENHIKSARDFAEKKGTKNVEFSVAGLHAIPFKGDEFDIIFLNDVVEHIRRPLLVDALSECRRVVKPGGLICLEFPPWTSPDAAHLYDYIYIPWCQFLFSTDTLVKATEKMNPAARHGKLSYIEHFKELNRITIEEFKDAIAMLEFEVINFDRRMIKGIAFLQAIPFLNLFLTTRVVAVLSK
jgi:ubiquinone/menaquinone biosynthesis C-methylase UbiE